MAEKKSGKNAGREDLSDHDVPAADPFAELTRIMGFDPRKSAEAGQPEQASAAADFNIDLEQELMRELGDEAQFEDAQPVAAEAAPAVEPEDPAAEEFPQSEEVADVDLASLDIELADAVAATAEQEADDLAAAAEAVESQVEKVVADEILADEAVASGAEEVPQQVVSAVDEEEDLPVIHLSKGGSDDVVELRVVEQEEPVLESDALSEAELEEEFNALLGNTDHHPAAVAEPFAASAEIAEAQAHEDEVGGLEAELASTLNELSIEHAVELEAVQEEELQPTEEVLVQEHGEEVEEPPQIAAQAEEEQPAAEEVQPVSEAKAEETVVAEEDPFAMLAAMAQKYRVSEPSDSWRNSAQLHPQPVYAEAPRAPVTETPSAHVTEAPRAPVTVVAEEAAYVPVAETPRAPVVETPRVAVQARAMPMAPVPEVDTIDVPDQAVAMADDFDIPELEAAEELPAVAALDDLDTEFNNLLQQMSAHDRAPIQARTAPEPVQLAERRSHASQAYEQPTRSYGQAPAAKPYERAVAQAYQERAAAPVYQERAAAPAYQERAAAPVYHDRAPVSSSYDAPYQPAAAARGYETAQPAQARQDHDDIKIDLTEDELADAFDEFDAADAGDFDLDGDFEDTLSPAAYDEPAYQRKQGPRRGLVIAAIIGGVAILGVAGALAMSMMGDAQGSAPELVKSDQTPIKIRPDNPGGTVVPNQDSKVYETVAKTGARGGTAQEKLVNDTEEPIELAERLPENVDEDVIETDESGKSEDRIEQVSTEEPAADEAIAVAPRKVRTMVVKPDGSLAPREEVQQEAVTAAPNNATAAPIEPAKDDVAKQISGEAKPEAQAEQPEGVAAEQTASIDPQPAVTGGWTMQIASEGSEEAAKAAYQKMLGRYPNLLEGKGVSIVKADIAGKGTFWRVRIPAQTRNEAADLCSSFKSAGGKCFVSKS